GGFFQFQDIQYNQPATTVTAGSNVTVSDRELTTVATDVTFDVIEPAGQAQIDVTQPYIYGYAYRSDGYAYINSQNYQTGSRPSVHVVGTPGTYSVQAYAYVFGTWT